MDLNRLIPAVQRVRTSTPSEGSRTATYLRTYPALLAVASYSDMDDSTGFLQLATIAYGWMPRIVRLDPNHLNRAVAAFREARKATDLNGTEMGIADVAACLHSVVGASKLLHFVNPKLFPIWDRNVEGFRLSTDPSQHHMHQVKNYTAYTSEVHEIRQNPMFSEFYRAFNQGFKERLRRLKIPPYCLTEVRSVESAVFELARNEYDEGEPIAVDLR